MRRQAPRKAISRELSTPAAGVAVGLHSTEVQISNVRNAALGSHGLESNDKHKSSEGGAVRGAFHYEFARGEVIVGLND